MPQEIPAPSALWEKLIRHFGKQAGESRFFGHPVGKDMAIGAEYQPAGSKYRWHGLHREDRMITFQWTLEGEGNLRIGKKHYPQTPGKAFFVTIPSDHEYRVLRKGPGWKFFWIRMNNVRLMEMLAETMSGLHNTFPLDFSSRLAIETMHFFELAQEGKLEDPFDAEKAALVLMVEMKRHLYHLCHPHNMRDEILHKVEGFYQKNKTRSFGVEDFARMIGMSRVQASLYFRKYTGLTLAAYFLELRLKDAVTLIGQGYKLDYIATETGFASANHFCKVFRRVYHTSPGQFRIMLGTKSTREK